MIVVRVIQSLFELVHEKNQKPFATLVCYLPPNCGFFVILLEVKSNYPPFGREASSDPVVEVSQLDVDQAHQPQGGHCRLQPLCATEYFCPLQYPRVVSVYLAMLIAQHWREGVQDGMDASLMLKCLLCNVYI